MILYIKAIHIISVISWFAGLIYLGRLFIYHAEAESKSPEEKRILQAQFKIMEKRVIAYICMPAMTLSIGFGLWLAYEMSVFLQPWFHVKMAFVGVMIIYQIHGIKIRRQLDRGVLMSSIMLRCWNEGGTLLLIGIVFIATTKELVASMVATGITAVLIGGALWVAKKRKTSTQ